MEELQCPSERSATARWATWKWWCICAIVFSLLYMATCQRGASWQDSGTFQRRVLQGDYTGKLGLALAHPLYIAVARGIAAVPIGNVAGRLNFFSGLGMAVALANLMALTTLLTGRRRIGLGVAAMLSVCHTIWWLATITEVYTWVVAGLTAELWLLVILIRRPSWRPLTALALISGLGLCTHNFALLPLMVYVAAAVVLVARRKLPPWSLAAAAGGYLLGASAYIVMTVQLAITSGSLGGAISSALFGEYAPQVLNASTVSAYAKANAMLAALNFTSLLLPLAILGWVRMRRRLGAPTAAAIGAVTVIHVLFVLRYPVPDQFTFLLPSLMMIGIAAAVGLGVLADASLRWRRAAVIACIASVIVPPIVYAAAPAVARSCGVTSGRARKLPYRDELRYWITPWKHDEDSAERFAAAALEIASPNGVILADSTSGEPLEVLQLRGGVGAGVVVLRGGAADKLYASFADQASQPAHEGRLYVVSPTSGHAPGRLLEDVQQDRVLLEPIEQDYEIIMYRVRRASVRP